MKYVLNGYDTVYPVIRKKNTAAIVLLWSLSACTTAAFYIYYCSVAFAAVYYPFAGRTMGLFAIALVISLALLIYPFIMLSRMAKEINLMCHGDDRHLMPFVLAWLLGCLTMGIYMIYYMYTMQKRLYDRAPGYDVRISVAGRELVLWILLLSCFFGVGFIVGIAIIVRSFNKVAEGFNVGFYNYLHEEEAEEDTMQTRALRCISGELRGSSIIMSDGDEIVIGRDPNMADLVVNDSKVSRKHCRIKYDGGSGMFYVTDYSSNGTTLGDGRKLEKNVDTLIAKGTVINLSSDTSFTVK